LGWRDFKRRHWPDALYVRAEELLNAGSNAPSIQAALRDEAKDPQSGFTEIPSEKTLRDWIAQGVLQRQSVMQPWTVEDAERPEDIPLVLETISLFRHPTDRWWPTVARGRWIARLMRAGLDPMVAFTFAGIATREDPLTFTRRLVDLFDEPRQAARTKKALRSAQAEVTNG
jgi:hypothetical protein